MEMMDARLTSTTELVPGVRWLLRHGERVLQERWCIKTYRQIIEVTELSEIQYEWRDVPVITETE